MAKPRCGGDTQTGHKWSLCAVAPITSARVESLTVNVDLVRYPALNETDSVHGQTRETSMKIRFSWLAVAGAALLVILAVPAAPAA